MKHIIDHDGNEYFYLDDGTYHIFYENGNEFWYDDNGEYHREKGPALIYNDGKEQAYFKHGDRHRLDGPAIKSTEYECWYIEGRKYSEAEFLRIVKLKELL
jgi:hypothetical protein